MSWPGEELNGQRLELGATSPLGLKPNQMQTISFLKVAAEARKLYYKEKTAAWSETVTCFAHSMIKLKSELKAALAALGGADSCVLNTRDCRALLLVSFSLLVLFSVGSRGKPEVI